MEMIEDVLTAEEKPCKGNYMLAVNDTLAVLGGKWKLHLIAAIGKGHTRFNEILRSIPGLTPRMLSKELRDLETNGIVERQVHDTLPVLVEYTLTPSATSLWEVIDKMIEWGRQHRAEIMG